MVRRTQGQDRNKDADLLENGREDTGRGSVSWDKVREWHGHIYTTKCKIDSQWEAGAQHMEISSVLCDHLERWDREGGRQGDAGGKRYGDICICITDSLCQKTETDTPL